MEREAGNLAGLLSRRQQPVPTESWTERLIPASANGQPMSVLRVSLVKGDCLAQSAPDRALIERFGQP